MVSITIGGYRYFESEDEAVKAKRSDDDIVDYEAGLGWYIYSKREYKNNPRKRLFGF